MSTYRQKWNGEENGKKWTTGGVISPESGLLLKCQILFGFGVLVFNKYYYQRDPIKE